MESIKEILAKNQPALSPTSTKVEKTCACGVKFTDTIWTGRDGKELPGHNECPRCRELRQFEQRKAEAEKKLEEVSFDQETKWLTEDSNLPSKFVSNTFDNFNSKLQPKAFAAVKNLQWQWKDTNDDEGLPPKSLVLLSPGVYGVGKTHLVCALMNHIIATEGKATMRKDLYIQKHRCPVFFVSENELLRRIRNTYNRSNTPEHHEETEEDIYKKLEAFDLLIIDDVGKVRPRDLNFLQGVYFNIIDQKYNNSQPIILTTNLDFNELENHIGGACADRIREMAGKDGFILMKGQSYRMR